MRLLAMIKYQRVNVVRIETALANGNADKAGIEHCVGVEH